MPNSPRPENPHRSVRVEDDLWRAAGKVAAERGTTRAAVIQAALRAFVQSQPADQPADQPAERDVEALAGVIQGGDPRIQINPHAAAIEVLRSDWLAERIAQVESRSAIEVAAEVAAALGLTDEWDTLLRREYGAGDTPADDGADPCE